MVRKKINLGGGSTWFWIGSSCGGLVKTVANEFSISIKGREFLDQLSDYHILKNDSNHWRFLRLGSFQLHH
jgi:hypothetical protein